MRLVLGRRTTRWLTTHCISHANCTPHRGKGDAKNASKAPGEIYEEAEKETFFFFFFLWSCSRSGEKADESGKRGVLSLVYSEPEVPL